MNKPIRLAIAGALGRMGKMLITEIIKKKHNISLNVALVNKNSVFIKKDVGTVMNITPVGVLLESSLKKNINNFDILIDFSNTYNTMKNIEICRLYKKNIVIGTTGFNVHEKKIITCASQDIGIILSANFSIGINIMLKLLKITTHILGNSSDIEIIESHHRNKIDSPSGTASTIGETIANELNYNIDQNSIYRKKGLIGKREKQKIGFSIIRAGDIVGEHKVMFAESGERLEINHIASNRLPFAIGAIRSAIWLNKKQKGLFTMSDVLNI
ncbi:MAG TPA: 4-hydroxy-tetrahydrodipicolinate reductase [Buchnera sp. (in: enterobacteria)]|nr:4-hydroxy-tetrahydrodipicolinate reductase [Buchnera sp. (in: enterobacteria)]